MRAWIAAAFSSVIACDRGAPPPPKGETPLAVPHTTAPIAIDDSWSERVWSNAMRGVFVDAAGAVAQPGSELRAMRDDTTLFVALYASDENIVRADRFELAFGAFAFAIDATGTIAPPVAGVRAKAVVSKGTLDDAHDDDIQWIGELAIPLAMFPGGNRPVPVVAKRCDTPKDGIPRCGQWSGTIALP